MGIFGLNRNLVEGDNISIEQNNNGDLVINSMSGPAEALAAMLNWESIKASRTFDTEVWTGKTAGTDRVYGKVIDLGVMPGASTKSVSINVESFGRFVGAPDLVNTATNGNIFSLPYVSPGNVNIQLLAYYSPSAQAIVLTSASSAFAAQTGVAFLEYTCTDR